MCTGDALHAHQVNGLESEQREHNLWLQSVRWLRSNLHKDPFLEAQSGKLEAQVQYELTQFSRLCLTNSGMSNAKNLWLQSVRLLQSSLWIQSSLHKHLFLEAQSGKQEANVHYEFIQFPRDHVARRDTTKLLFIGLCTKRSVLDGK